MAKDLTGSNVAAEKEKDVYTPVWLIDLVRDHPETGESSFRISSWSGPYAVGGNTYQDKVAAAGDVRIYMTPGGGLALVSDWTLAINNPKDLPGGGRESDMLDEYFLENDEVRYSLVFRDGSEGADDVLRMFTGLVQNPRIVTKLFSLNAKDGSLKTLRNVPQEFLDRVAYPDAPLNVQDVPYPVPFGNMNVEPFNTTGANPALAACVNVDIFESTWTSGLYCKTYGQPYVFYRSARIYGKIVSYTQSGSFFDIDSASRFISLLPMRPDSGNDVTTWKNAAERDAGTSVTLTVGDNLDLRMKGTPKLGTVTSGTNPVVVISGSGENVGYTISKTGETGITGTTSSYPESIDLSSWDFSSDWDFENVIVKLNGPASSSTTITSVTLDITFDETETGDRLAFPVFQSVTGYQDVATQYQDGAVIVSANQLLRNPIHVALALMRDKSTGMRMETAEIETSNIVAEVAKISAWNFDFTLTGEQTKEAFSQMLRQGKIRMFRTFDNKWKLTVFDETDDPVAAFFDATNIAVRNPKAKPEERDSAFELSLSPLTEVYNEIVLDYGWNAALGVFTKQTVATHHYTLTGTATLDSSAGTLTDGSATFVADGVQVGHKVFVVRDKLYDVDSIDSETVLTVSPTDPAEPMADRSDTYYLGPNYDFNCHRSLLKYKQPNRITIPSLYVQEDATAALVLQYWVDYFSQRRYMVRFKTWLNAVDVEVGDLVVLDHPDIPASKRPANLATLGANATKAATTITLSGTGAALTRTDDRLIMKPADGKRLVREMWKCTDTDAGAGTIDVTRAYSGTQARPWSSGDQLQRIITKWEVVEMRIIRATNEIEITARETPRDYTPIGHAAPSGIPAYSLATAEQRALYGFCAYPNGELSWLDEGSAVSFARTS